MGFTPKRLRRQLIAAAKRVEARGDRPPWKRHPRPMDLALYITDELSARETRWIRNHLASCRACVERKERLAHDLPRAGSSRQAIAVVKAIAREGQGGAR
jgi:hypothetical protein